MCISYNELRGMNVKVILFCLLSLGSLVLRAADVPSVWVIGDNLSKELVGQLKSDLTHFLIFGREASKQTLCYQWKNCPSGSEQVCMEVKNLRKVTTTQKQSRILLLNCGWGDFFKNKQLIEIPDTITYRNNLKQIVTEAQKQDLEVLWYTIPFCKEKQINDHVELYNQVALQVMVEENVRVVDFYHYWKMQVKDSVKYSTLNNVQKIALQSSYLSESLSQWWTACAQGNRSIQRVKLWERIPPHYVYEGK